jgi:hypothetical protein
MKWIFTILLAVAFTSAFSQPYPRQQRVYTISGFTMLGWFPHDYNTSSDSFPLILHFVGAGVSDSTSCVGDGSGLGTIPKQLAQGTWDGRQFIPNSNFPGGDTAKYIVFTFTNTSDQSWPPNVDGVVTALLAAYRIRTNYMSLAGWSQGATDLFKYRGDVFEQGLTHNLKFIKIFPIATGTTGLIAANWTSGGVVKARMYVGSTDVTTGPALTNGEAALINNNSPNPSEAEVRTIEGSGHDVTDTAYQHDVEQAEQNVYIWFISDTAGNPTYTKINILPRMVWGPNGNFGTGSQSLLDTFTNKWGNVIGRAFTITDGDVDPLNDQYDFDTARSGFQNDTTLGTGLLQRPSVHDFWDMGIDSQIVVVIDLERLHDIDAFFYNDSTGSSVSAVADITFCDSLEEARALVLEFEGTWGTPTPDYTLNASGTRGYKTTLDVNKSCQFIVIRFNRLIGTYPNEIGAAFSTFGFYGNESPLGTRDIRITPAWDDVIVRDTTFAISRLGGYVEAHPTPNYPNWESDTATLWSGLGGYIAPIATTTNGAFDQLNVAYTGPTSTKWNATPYNGAPLFNTADTTWRKQRRNYLVDRAARTYLLKQTDSANLNYIPLNAEGDDFRLSASYEAYKWQFLRGAARAMYEIPDTTNAVGQYLTESYIENNPHSGRYAWGLFTYWIPFNENWAGYRAGGIPGSNYQNPKSIFEMHDLIKRAWDSVFNVMPTVSQGFAAWGMEGIIEAEFIGRLKYLNREHPLADILNMHPTISTWVRDIDGGCAGNGESQGYLAGIRNERAKMQAFIDTMRLLSGLQRKVIVTEIAVESHIDFEVPDSTCSNGVGGLGAKQVDTENYLVSQAIHIYQDNMHYYFVQGLEALFGYEMMDAADSSGIYYNATDGAAGRIQGYHDYYKPAFFAEGFELKWLQDYRGILLQSDSIEGNWAGLLRHTTSRDSFCLSIMWQNYTPATNARTYSLFSDVTTATNRQAVYGTDWGFNGTSSTPTVTSGNIVLTPSQKGNLIFFKSPALASYLDGTSTHFFRINKNVIRY